MPYKDKEITKIESWCVTMVHQEQNQFPYIDITRSFWTNLKVWLENRLNADVGSGNFIETEDTSHDVVYSSEN